jgi:RNA polymerase sigma-70 factor (ECF subfamily)
MRSDSSTSRLSRISTLWSVVLQAHGGLAEQANVACEALVRRYRGAAHRYLLAVVGDRDVADDLTQEFVLRFLRGKFRGADPARGRFRDYLKTTLIHLVRDYHRARQRWPQALAANAPEPAALPIEDADSERAFLTSWRDELLERTWTALADFNAAFHAVLSLRVANPELRSPQMAERLTAQSGKSVNAAWVRKTLQRAHEKYAELLLEDVAHSLPEATPEALEKELEELDLLRYCRTALEQWAR